MKILLINTSTGYGGLEMNLLKLADSFDAQGVEVHIACRKGTRIAEKTNARYPILQFNHVRKYFDFGVASILVNYLKRTEISVVFTVYRPDLDMLCWAKKMYPTMKIVHQQHMQMGIKKKGLIHRIRYQAIDRWVTPLEYLKNEALEKTHLREEQIRVIPIGVDVERFLGNTATVAQSRAYFDLPQDVIILGVLGRIDPKKGQQFVVEMTKQLNARGEQVHLLIVGEPTIDDVESTAYYNNLCSEIDEHGLKQFVHIRPFTQDTPLFYRAVDVCVMSSEGETYGMVTLEAMLSGTPVIATDSAGTPEVLDFGKRGMLYRPFDQKSFISAYDAWKVKREEGSLSLKKNQEEISQKYSMEQEISQLMDEFQQFI